MAAITLRQARDAYMAENGFTEASYTDRWVKVQLGPIPLVILSTKTRREAVRFHDLHHALTGYRATPRGEAEIGAWEIATGCGRFTAAWSLNLLAMGLGLLIAPGRTWRAWVRGRRSKTNLYHGEFDVALLERDLEAIQAELGLVAEPVVQQGDKLSFAVWSALAVLHYALLAALVLVPLAALAWWVWSR